MSDVTRLLLQIDQGNAKAVDQLLTLVYEELRNLAAAKLSRERKGQTLDATALVHEAYLRLLGGDGTASFKNQSHFFGAASVAMRRLLVERARRYRAQKRGGNWVRVEFTDKDLVSVGTPDQIVIVDEALVEFAKEEPTSMELVNLVLFCGFSVEKAGQLLEMSRPVSYRHWKYARAWLKSYISGQDQSR